MQRVEALLQRIEQVPDESARETARQLVQCLLELHGAGLATMLHLTSQATEAGRPLIDAFAADGLVASLLLLHGLHPVDIETRVRTALEKARPYLRSHGTEVELLGVTEGVVRLRLHGDRAASAETLRRAVQEAVYDSAPDAAAVEVEGLPAAGVAWSGRFPLPLA